MSTFTTCIGRTFQRLPLNTRILNIQGPQATYNIKCDLFRLSKRYTYLSIHIFQLQFFRTYAEKWALLSQIWSEISKTSQIKKMVICIIKRCYINMRFFFKLKICCWCNGCVLHLGNQRTQRCKFKSAV